MSTRSDPLTMRPEPPDRVFYATGVLLDAQDFEAEQIYHRGRLARALSYANGIGTVAGLGVAWERADSENRPVDRVVVEPGMAVDRLGRIIEVTRPACIRLQRWYDAQDTSDLARSYRHLVRITPDELTRRAGGDWTIATGTNEESIDGVVVDVFVKFVTCERGKTPSFASGPFDATDAVQPSRLRDGYELTLLPRVVSDPDLPLPDAAWPALDDVTEPAQRQRRLQDAILGRWRERSPYWTSTGPLSGPEHLGGQDPTALFLARMVLPASMTLADTARPVRIDPATEPVRVDNHLRSFVYTASALARVLPWAMSQPVDRQPSISTPVPTIDTTTTPTPPDA
jgi:hypothetical protein